MSFTLTYAVEPTDAFVYKDEKTGIEFTVPQNWSKGELSKGRDVLNVKFTSNLEAGLAILFGTIDVWEQIPDSEKSGFSRVDVDNSVFSVDEIAAIMEVPSSKVSKVTYGNKEFFKAETESSSSEYGISLNISMTSMISIDNGYLYLFEFGGDSKNPYYKDFESVLTSIKYSAY